MDVDLATCCDFKSLRALQAPSKYPQHNLNNVFFQLGAAHTSWNISHTIFKTHFGDPKLSLDTGGWHVLNSLGFPHNKPMPKRDFSLILKYMERLHEATMLYCIE